MLIRDLKAVAYCNPVGRTSFQLRRHSRSIVAYGDKGVTSVTFTIQRVSA